MASSQQIIISTADIGRELTYLFSQVAPEVTIIDFSPIIEHYVDCYLLGSIYRDNTMDRDPLIELFYSFKIPTELSIHITYQLRESIHALMMGAIGVISTDYDYLVTWPMSFMGIIEPVIAYSRYRDDYLRQQNKIPIGDC